VSISPECSAAERRFIAFRVQQQLQLLAMQQKLVFIIAAASDATNIDVDQ
jgi:hypothetical protein